MWHYINLRSQRMCCHKQSKLTFRLLIYTLHLVLYSISYFPTAISEENSFQHDYKASYYHHHHHHHQNSAENDCVVFVVGPLRNTKIFLPFLNNHICKAVVHNISVMKRGKNNTCQNISLQCRSPLLMGLCKWGVIFPKQHGTFITRNSPGAPWA